MCGKLKYAFLSDFSTILQIPLNALKVFIWALLVLVRLHLAFKVCGEWEYAGLSDFSAFLRIPLYALKASIWPLLVSVKLLVSERFAKTLFFNGITQI